MGVSELTLSVPIDRLESLLRRLLGVIAEILIDRTLGQRSTCKCEITASSIQPVTADPGASRSGGTVEFLPVP